MIEALTGCFDEHYAQLARPLLHRLEMVEAALAELDAIIAAACRPCRTNSTCCKPCAGGRRAHSEGAPGPAVRSLWGGCGAPRLAGRRIKSSPVRQATTAGLPAHEQVSTALSASTSHQSVWPNDR